LCGQSGLPVDNFNLKEIPALKIRVFKYLTIKNSLLKSAKNLLILFDSPLRINKTSGLEGSRSLPRNTEDEFILKD
jgi:hypothetical protein